MENKIFVQAGISAAAAGIAAYFGVLALPLFVLLVMMILDYATGMTAAWMRGELSSKVGAKGIMKKVGYMALIVVAAGVDYLIWVGVAAVQVDVGYKMWFGLLVAVWLIINEMISILENLSRMDVPLPDFLVKAIEKAKNSIDTKKKEDKHD